MIGLEEMEEREDDVIESLLVRTIDLMNIDPDIDEVLRTLAVNTAILEHMMIIDIMQRTPSESLTEEINKFSDNFSELKNKVSSRL